MLAPDRRAADERPPRSSATACGSSCIDHGDDLVAYARELYAELRAADAAGADRIVAVDAPRRGLGHAIRDRLTKAAAGRPLESQRSEVGVRPARTALRT